jgi:hypothetical protein
MEELDPTDQRIEADQFLTRVNVASKLLNNFIAHIAGITQSQAVYQRRYDKLAA